jgi:hypothetical protein
LQPAAVQIAHKGDVQQDEQDLTLVTTLIKLVPDVAE